MGQVGPSVPHAHSRQFLGLCVEQALIFLYPAFLVNALVCLAVLHLEFVEVRSFFRGGEFVPEVVLSISESILNVGQGLPLSFH